MIDIEFQQPTELTLPSAPPELSSQDTPEMPLGGPKKRGRKPGVKNKPKDSVNAEAKTQLHLLTVAVLGMCCAVMIKDAEMHPTSDEYDAILGPLENLVLRRYSVSGMLSPDANDIIMFSVGVAMYGIRISSIRGERKASNRIAKQQAQARNPEPVRTSPEIPFGGIGGNWDALDNVTANAASNDGA